MGIRDSFSHSVFNQAMQQAALGNYQSANHYLCAAATLMKCKLPDMPEGDDVLQHREWYFTNFKKVFEEIGKILESLKDKDVMVEEI